MFPPRNVLTYEFHHTDNNLKHLSIFATIVVQLFSPELSAYTQQAYVEGFVFLPHNVKTHNTHKAQCLACWHV